MPILKPDTCKGCPFYDKSRYITPDYIIRGTEVTILAQAPGEHEEFGRKITGSRWSSGKKDEVTESVRPQPLIGQSGQWLQREFFPLTKLDYSRVSKCNVIKCRPYNSNELPNVAGNQVVNRITVKELKLAIQHCTSNHLNIPENTKYLLAMGEISLYALTGEELLNYKKELEDDPEEQGKKTQKKSTITDWRGWVLGIQNEGFNHKHRLLGLYDYFDPHLPHYKNVIKVFPVIHLASLFKNDTYYHATLLDFKRFGRLVRQEWPSRLPDIRINEIPSSIPSLIGFDTEYRKLDETHNELTMWSLADEYSNIFVVDSHYSSSLKNLPERLKVITQNGIVDLPHLLPLLPDSFDFRKMRVEDCMLGHATLWPGEYHSLDYQLSKIGSYNRHKHLRETDDNYLKYIYAGLDADTTLNNAWKAQCRIFRKDQLSWNEYLRRRQPLMKIISRFNERGILVDQERVKLVSELLDKEMERIQNEARALTGNPHFNIRSNDQLKAALFHNNFFTNKVKESKTRSKKQPLTVQELVLKFQKEIRNERSQMLKV